MTKHEAEVILQEKINELDSKTKTAENTEEYLQLVDGITKIYTMLAGADGFEDERPKMSTANLGS